MSAINPMTNASFKRSFGSDSEGCGICEKEGSEVYWVSPYSRTAHAKCVKVIEKAESKLWNVINIMYDVNEHDGYYQRNIAHMSAIQVVRWACGSETLLSYCEKNGIEALTHLFNTIGTRDVILQSRL